MRHNTTILPRKTDRAKAIDKAMREAKAAFDNECIMTLTSPVDGAHIYPRSTYPELAACEYNIVPLTREKHQYMDTLPTTAARLKFLIECCHSEKFGKLSERLERLEKIKGESK